MMKIVAMTGQNKEDNYIRTGEVCMRTIGSNLGIWFKMVPSTIVAKLCEVIDSIFKNIPKQSEIAFAKFIQQAIKAFGDPSRGLCCIDGIWVKGERGCRAVTQCCDIKGAENIW